MTAYVEALRERVLGEPLIAVRVNSPFVLRTFEPPLAALHGRRVVEARRVGKRIVLALEGGFFLSIHLMIAGRLAWKAPDVRPKGRGQLATLEFPKGAVLLTEQATRQRAAMHAIAGEADLRTLDAGGIEPLDATPAQFAEALRRETHTLKRTLTDPRVFAGIGNAYSDEILHAARLSPMQLTTNLDDSEVERLREATIRVLAEWTERLRRERKGGWPTKVMAFRKGMAVHGRFGEPCPDCGTAIQRIVRGESESHYCPRCQTGGRMLADRSLSKLMHDDWPATIDAWEARFQGG
ncbi:MAG: formamidopyrimidine-DNA glycosylase [Thermoplasmata archaeon]|nr:formamidopyrimidine-DNA glycosylase [Thermoplasmata archaeon]